MASSSRAPTHRDQSFEGRVRNLLSNTPHFRYFRWFEELPSTNDFVKARATDLPHRALIGATRQMAGRGTHGRSWDSTNADDLYFSVLLKKNLRAVDLPMLTLATALAVVECMDVFGVRGSIKWPNDILLGGKKACGILIESAVQGASVSSAVVGVGLNVGRAVFAPELADEATSISLESGEAQDRAAVLAEFLCRHDAALGQSFNGLVDRVGQRLAWRGKRVDVDGQAGTLLGLHPSGALRLKTARGESRFSAGRLRLLPEV